MPRCIPPAAVVVEYDGVAGDVGEPAVDLDDIDAASRQQRSSGSIGRGDDHAGRPHGEKRAGAGELLCLVAVVGDEDHLIVGFAQRRLDSRGEVRVELVAEIGDGDADDAARLLFQRPGRRIRDVAEPIGRLAQAGASVLGDVAAAAERARGGRGRRARRPRDVGERDRPGKSSVDSGAHDRTASHRFQASRKAL